MDKDNFSTNGREYFPRQVYQQRYQEDFFDRMASYSTGRSDPHYVYEDKFNPRHQQYVPVDDNYQQHFYQNRREVRRQFN
jgi:hypothetical protein